jgi:hypothetical protein
LYGPAARHHGDASEVYVGEEGLVSGGTYVPCAAGDFPRGDDGRLPGDVHGPCSARLSRRFFSHPSFLETLVLGTYPVISSRGIKPADVQAQTSWKNRAMGNDWHLTGKTTGNAWKPEKRFVSRCTIST